MEKGSIHFYVMVIANQQSPEVAAGRFALDTTDAGPRTATTANFRQERFDLCPLFIRQECLLIPGFS
jgi:hypothetical protein